MFEIVMGIDDFLIQLVKYCNEKYVIHGQTKKSTNSFYSYASLYITNKNERFTVSVLPVEKNKKMVEYLSYFVDLIKRLNFKIKVLCLVVHLYSVVIIPQ